MNRTVMRIGAATAAAALTILTVAPAHAAIVSQSTANALTLGIAGNEFDSGTVQATHDGTSESVTGETNPTVGLLDGQDLLQLSVLAQEATARVLQNGDGNSFACSGVAGEGGAVVEVGDSSCIAPGEPISVSLANVDLSNADLFNVQSALAPLNAIGDPLIDALLGPLTSALADAIGDTALGEIGLFGSLGAVEARCVALPGSAEGTANIVDGDIYLQIPGGDRINLVSLPANPAPNTEVLVQIDDVVNVLLDGVEQQVANMLDGALAEVNNALLNPLRDLLLDELLEQLNEGLLPLTSALQDNLLKVVLNKQSASAGYIEVTGLSLEVLPAAIEFIDAPLVNAEIANVTCGPNGRFAPPTGPEGPEEPEEPKEPKEPKLPEVPTVVASGVSGGPNYGGIAVGLLLTLALAGGLLGRRSILQ
ncbi:hypothetical protein [Nocardioides limicola]|uniref:hypothetical protein n=1 Tax=Nocardioides limicola TaxID=2803368 RepID=UPI00193B247C|nr:hypothetical protein [Nocardioides sp. DJM-14]